MEPMSLLDRLTHRVLTLLGLEFDLSLDPIGSPSFHQITPILTLGSRPRREHVEVLLELGVTHVVSCLEESQRPSMAFLSDGFDTTFIPLRDGMLQDIGAAIPRFFDVVSRAGPAATVLVHCEAGVSRSAALVIAHVMQTQRLRFREAYRAVRTRRPHVMPNVGFASQLQHLEHTLFPESRGDGTASLAWYLHEVCKVPVEVEVLQGMLELHDYDALRAIRAIFGDDIPRVVQGVRV